MEIQFVFHRVFQILTFLTSINLSCIIFFDLYYLIIWIFGHLNIAVFTFVVIDVMPVTD